MLIARIEELRALPPSGLDEVLSQPPAVLLPTVLQQTTSMEGEGSNSARAGALPPAAHTG